MIARYASMAVFLALVVLASAISGSFEAGHWYYSMNKPSLDASRRGFLHRSGRF